MKKMSKKNGRQIAKEMSKKTGKKVSYVMFDDKGYYFQVQFYKTYHYVDIDGKETPSYISDKWVKNSYKVYSEVCCFNSQAYDGSLEMMINAGYTQDLTFRNDG